jgi:hypothetical protein
MENIILDIQLEKIYSAKNQELADNIHTACNFCDNIININSLDIKQCLNLGHGKMYCTFCLKHQFYQKDSHNILILTFKEIIDCFYNNFYNVTNRTMWLSDIEPLVEEHIKIGLQHPLFFYNSQNKLWHIDFRRIGETKHKLPIRTVSETIQLILESFNLRKYFPSINEKELLSRYDKAIKLFYRNRKRPIKKKILAPTLNGLGIKF